MPDYNKLTSFQQFLKLLPKLSASFVDKKFSSFSGLYTERVLDAVKLLGMEVMPNFAGKAETAVDALRDGTPQTIDENEFIDASRLVYDGVSWPIFYYLL